jgi:hypothetical protein
MTSPTQPWVERSIDSSDYEDSCGFGICGSFSAESIFCAIEQAHNVAAMAPEG